MDVQEFEKYFNQILESARKQISVPGFRPGRVPVAVAENRIDSKYLLSEAGEKAVIGSLAKVIDENKWETIGEPRVEIKKIARGSEFVFEATIALLPKVALNDWKKILMVKKDPSVSEEEINKFIENLRKERAEDIAVGRTAVKGDRVAMEYEMFMDGVRTEEGLQKGDKITLGDGIFLEEFENNLVGAKTDDKKIFTIKYKEDYPQKRFAGKVVEFRVKVNGVYEIKLPEATDEWAKSLGAFQNLAALREVVKENLRMEKRIKEDERLELAALDEILKGADFEELPETLIDGEKEKMMAEFKESTAHQGLEFSKYLEMIKKTEEDLKKELTPQAEKRLKTALVLREIVKAENISVSRDEVKNELDLVLEEHKGHNHKEHEHFQSGEFKRHLENILLSRKAVEFIKKQIVK